MNIDSASKAELLSYAEDELGLVLDPQLSIAELRAKIKEADDFTAPAPEPKKRAAAKPKARPKKVRIHIHKTEDQTGASDVFVGVNGKSYLLKRGVDFEVPFEVYEGLKNAITEKRTIKRVRRPDGTMGTEMEVREVQSYPFSVVA